MYMGTPDFAVAPLDGLIKAGYNIVGVITAPDKPAGRGLELHESAVKKYAKEQGLKILQPEKLKNPDFLAELKSLDANLQIVVAFRMLPEIVWNMPELGTFNLHASLLPQYRGAAPINWAVINGEKESGVTTFFLQHEIDTGDIIFQEKVAIHENTTAGELHDELMNIGTKLVVKTTEAIENNAVKQIPQNTINGELKHAPKIFKDDCKINWNNTAQHIHNLVRGLSPYPTAFTDLISPEGKTFGLKIFKTLIADKKENSIPNKINTDGKTFIHIACNDGWLNIIDIQLAGKKRMLTADFLKGFKMDDGWSVG